MLAPPSSPTLQSNPKKRRLKLQHLMNLTLAIPLGLATAACHSSDEVPQDSYASEPLDDQLEMGREVIREDKFPKTFFAYQPSSPKRNDAHHPLIFIIDNSNSMQREELLESLEGFNDRLEELLENDQIVDLNLFPMHPHITPDYYSDFEPGGACDRCYDLEDPVIINLDDPNMHEDVPNVEGGPLISNFRSCTPFHSNSDPDSAPFPNS